jgi:predicted DNA-binding transcriptional regulator AlpA
MPQPQDTGRGGRARRLARYPEMVRQGYFQNKMSPQRMEANGFPPPYQLGPHTVAWDLDEAEAWLATRKKRRSPKSDDNNASHEPVEASPAA